MIDPDEKRAVLEKILKSNPFNRGDKYATLLAYLVESNLQGKIPKEYSIAIDVFEKEKDFNPAEDTIVRYHMYHLRKRIDEYYENEGQHDKIRLVIPKGHYAVQFVSETGMRKRFWQRYKKRDWIYFSTLLIVVAIALFFCWQQLTFARKARLIDHPISLNDPIWSSFFANRLPTLVIIGDHLLLREYDPDAQDFREEYIYNIVTNSDLADFLSRHSRRVVEKLDHGSLPHNSIFNIHDIEHVFYCFTQRPTIQFTSEYLSKPTDLPKIIDRNFIYMGGFSDMRQLEQVLAKLPIQYRYTDTYRGDIIIHDTKTDSTLTFSCKVLDGGRFLDLGLIAKIPGSNLENYLFLAGFAYPAQIEIVRMVSRPENLARLYKQVLKPGQSFPPYFCLVVEFISSEYTAQEINIKYFSSLPNK